MYLTINLECLGNPEVVRKALGQMLTDEGEEPLLEKNTLARLSSDELYLDLLYEPGTSEFTLAMIMRQEIALNSLIEGLPRPVTEILSVLKDLNIESDRFNLKS